MRTIRYTYQDPYYGVMIGVINIIGDLLNDLEQMCNEIVLNQR